MSRPHLLLVGLPGSGKTTVGAVTAGRLNIPFYDADDVIEAREGRSVRDLFATRGEFGFRQLERQVVEELLDEPGSAVISPGGGWAAQPGNLEGVGARALIIHLSVSPEVAAQRLGEGSGRPLLAGDPLARLRELATAREAFYARAQARVPTDGRSPDAVAADLVELARSGGE